METCISVGRLASLTGPQHFVAQLKDFKTYLRVFSLSSLERMVMLAWVVIFFPGGILGDSDG